ncbi:ATPase domain-containing protein [Aureimonas sp. AU40]|uniref:ATPase domain-containing protein n=1 Tax=Aureimonas sp. AU40 TaxID=1637747 RepID=UPI000785D3B7|nr:ATPase domain-containing protein [Aureimonas sp. AU40]
MKAAAPAVRTSADVLAKLGRAGLGHTILDASRPDVDHRRHIPTGIYELDRMCMGGIPASAITQVVGRQGSGKSSLCDRITASAQRIWPEHKVARVDVEGTQDFEWAALHGVDPSRVILSRPETAEDAMNTSEELVRASDVSIVIVDSVAAMMPSAMSMRSIGDTIPGVRARLVNEFLTRVGSAIVEARNAGRTVTLVVVNQYRQRFVVRGDVRTIPGGEGLNYFPSFTVSMDGFTHYGKDAFGDEAAMRLEMTFQRLKSKLGSGTKEGKATMILDPSHPLGLGAIDQADDILDFTDKRGLTARPSTVRCDLGAFSTATFRTLRDRADHLRADPALQQTIYDAAISAWRVERGKGAGEWKAAA